MFIKIRQAGDSRTIPLQDVTSVVICGPQGTPVAIALEQGGPESVQVATAENPSELQAMLRTIGEDHPLDVRRVSG